MTHEPELDHGSVCRELDRNARTITATLQSRFRTGLFVIISSRTSIYRNDIINRMLDIAILGLLMDRDHHGYEIRTQVRDRLACPPTSPLVRSTPPSIGSSATDSSRRSCPAKRVVTRCRPVHSRANAPRFARCAPRQDSAVARRKVYRITERGRQEFVSLLADPATLDDSRNFSLRMALAKYLTPSLRVTLLERRRTILWSAWQKCRPALAMTS